MRTAFRSMMIMGVLLLLLVSAGSAVADPQHQNPDEIGNEDIDLGQFEEVLAERLEDRHIDCTEGLQVGNFDACEDLDDEYSSTLEQYVTVEQEATDGENQQAEQFNETRNTQRELAALVEEFNTTREAYRQARADGDSARARELARELRRLADRIRALGGELEVSFRRLGETTDSDFEEAAMATNQTVIEIRSTTQEAARESFDPATVSVTADGIAAFTTPVTVSGTLRSADGSPIANARIRITDGNRTIVAQTDDEGDFSQPYRPTTTARGKTTLTARYIPAPASPHLGAEATTTVIAGTAPTTVSLSNVSSEARFNGSVRVQGRLTAAAIDAPGVPIRAVVGGQASNQTRTNANGRFNLTVPIGAKPAAGTATIQVTAAQPGQALLPSKTSANLTIRETPTALSLAVDPNQTATQVAGQLTAESGPVANQTVVIIFDQQRVPVTTNAEGRFNHTINGTPANSTVVARYSESDTNLGPSHATATIETNSGLAERLRSGLATVIAAARSEPLVGGGLLAGVGMNVGIWTLVWRQRRRRQATQMSSEPSASDEQSSATDEEPTAETALAVSETTVAEAKTLLETAHNQVQTSPQVAIQVGYAAVRRRFNETETNQTHWEFYNEYQDTLDETEAGALRSLIESFELATFAPKEPDSDRAAAALAAAQKCLDIGTETGQPDDPAD